MQDYIPQEKDINDHLDTVTVKQFDNNSRFLHVKFKDVDLTDVDDDSFDLTDCTAALYIKPKSDEDDENVNFVNGTIESAESGIVTFLLPGGVTQNVGRYECEIWIYQGDETTRPVISTKPFTLVVEKSIKNDSAIEATSDYSALTVTMTNFQALKNQMAALAASPAGSGGDVGTELRDVRIGADGTEYSTAGDAVRAQVENLAADTAYLNGVIEWESGAFAGDKKTKTANTARIRNTRLIPIDQYQKLTLPDGYKAYFFLFDEKKVYHISTGLVNSLPVFNVGNLDFNLKYVNIQITKTGEENSDISSYINDVKNGFVAVLRSKTDTSLSTSNLPADAKTVGDALNSLTGNLSSVDTALSKRIFAKDASAYVDNGSVTLGNIVEDGFYVIDNTWTITDAPSGLAVQALTVEHFSTTGANRFVKQTAESMTHPEYPRYHRCSNVSGVWSNWVNDTSDNITINNNTYNVTSTPTLTSGLPYVLQSTGDTADRTADIAAVLTQYGSCYLGTGIFYVKNLTMPDNTSIIGSGIGLKTVGSNVAGGTTLRLIDDDVNECYAVGVRTRCSISNLVINGGSPIKPETEGLRHGLSYQGTYMSSQNPGTYPIRGQISNLDIKGFSGSGIICSNTSGNTKSGMNAVNVNIYDCYNGIEIRDYSEYHRFTNISIVNCVNGCINNGGNNMFVNCGFNGNTTGFVIDVSGNEAPNDAHGSAVGCTFNHSGNNSGIAIKLVGVTNGYVFDGCQVFYGKIDMKNSVGVQFSNCNIGRQAPIDIDGGGVILFNGNIFVSTPTVTKTNSPIIKTANCYAYDGSAITI